MTLPTFLLALLIAAGVLYARHWLMWAFVIWAFAGSGHPPAEDDWTPLDPARGVLAAVAFALLLAIISPWPA